MQPILSRLLLLLLCYATALPAQQLNDDPHDARFVYEDIGRFWMAFDSAQGKPEDRQQAIYQSIYIDPATVGFRSWLDKREKSVAELVSGVNSMLPFYRSLRTNMDHLTDYERDMRAGFYALEYLYPEARFPDVYFFVWHFFATGSTTTDVGLMIAAETQTVSDSTPLDAIPEIHRPMVRSMDLASLAGVAVHESVHEQQPDFDTENLLELALREGTADFIAELCTGSIPSYAVHAYADSRRQELWEEFKEKMYTDNYAGWRFIPEDRPAGLAYWMSYQIAEAFYRQAADKRQAVRELIESTDYRDIFIRSRYAEQFD